MTTKQWKRDNQVTQDLIGLVSDKLAMLSVIETWTDEQCQQAQAWASAKYLRTISNAIRVLPPPLHVAALPKRAYGAYDADLSHL